MLLAVLNFQKLFAANELPEFLRWGNINEGEAQSWLVKTASGSELKLKADNFNFQVNGEFVFENEVVREYWKEVFDKEKSVKEGSSKKGICLVSGESDVAISPSHVPKISGVRGASAMGASLVSFDKDSFRSYGIAKSYNSPISFAAVEAYTNALNFLVSDKSHSLQIGEATLCFWAKSSDDASKFFMQLLNAPDEDTLKKFLTSPFVGTEKLSELADDNFYSVTLGGNAGRVVVRNWMQTTVSKAAKNFHKWFSDLRIVPLRNHENDKTPPWNLFSLARSTVRDAKDLKPEVPTQLYRAALEGHAPSKIIIQNMTNRIAIDLAEEGKSSLNNLSRFSLLKLIVNRNKKEEDPMIEEKLSTKIKDPAYNCGRLLAVFQKLQSAAHGRGFSGAGVVEKYYGTASSSPNSAFGILWRLHQHHLKKLSRDNKGASVAIKNEIADICAQFEGCKPEAAPQFPRSFDLLAQGRFALGFYQQVAADKEARDAYFQNKQLEEKEGEEINE